MVKTCLFCGSPGPFSQEHVLPEWIAALLGVGRVQVKRQRLDTPASTWEKVGTFGHTVGNVCEICNNGWMSDLEDYVKPVLAPLIFPKRYTEHRLGPDEQMLLAAWLWKIAILHESVSDVSYFDETERHLLLNWD